MALNQPSPNEQRNAIIATVLIAIITLVWMWQYSPAPPEEAAPTNQEAPVVDTARAVAEEQARAREQARAQETLEPQAPGLQDSSVTAGAEARTVVVETERYEAVFSTQGATITSFQLKNYDEFDGDPVQIVGTTRQGALGLAFTTPQSRNVDSRALAFTTDFAGDTLRVTGDEEDASATLTFTAQVGEGALRQTYTFRPESYEIGLEVAREGAASFMTGAGFDLVWHGGLPFTEADAGTEAASSGAFALTGGDVVGVELSADDTAAAQSLRGDVAWTAVKNKYFTAALVPETPARGAELSGDRITQDSLLWEDFTARLQVAPDAQEAQSYRLYLGPLDYYELAKLDADLYDMVDYGWAFFEWMTRPLAKYFFIPLLSFLHGFIPSYGVAIILLAVIVKLLVYPLTKSSYKSMAKMRELQPRMEAIKEEYGDDPKKQQEAMMKMYKETGVNPIGGCLPMLLQYPVIIALWQFLPQSIDIRQQSFLWANDLSAPDVILNLPFEIPFYGDYVAGFTVLMGLSMVVQMRIQGSGTGASAGQMKVLMYLFPVMIFFIFNRFASGLSLYYLTYNVVTAIQQKYINHQIEQESEDEAAGASTNGRSPKTAEKADAKQMWGQKAKT